MLETIPLLVREGDRPPPCYGMSSDRVFYCFEEQCGRPAVLILMGARSRPVATDFVPYLTAFAARGADVLCVVDDNPAGLFGGALNNSPIRTIDSGAFLSRCGVGPDGALVVVLDRNLRVALRLSAEESRALAEACLDCLDELPSEAPRRVSMPAPVVVLPHLLTRAQCRDLIALFESSPTIDGAVARVDAAGNARSVVDHAKKRRRDLMIEPDTNLHRSLKDTLLTRCAPEILKAFQMPVCYTDRILISCYDDIGGWFRRHRDNAAVGVAFREFALSVNLNTGEYDGGHLLFPEYNDHCHIPPAGGGLIFSAGLLHEAAPVTAGRRYVLLTFFHGESAEARRVASEALAEG